MNKNIIIAAALVAAGTSVASADIIRQLGGGWEVVISSIVADRIDIVADGNNPTPPGTLVIEKFAQFTNVDEFGIPEGLSVTFRQVASDANTSARIVITDEALLNNTGFNWVGFQMTLVDSGQATWDQTLTSAASRAPFSTISYANGGTQAIFGGGSVADGAAWFPGLASGALVINVNLAANAPVVFSLKETPIIPTPGAVALAGMGLMVAGRRRRN
jgi:hypothetical protein